jgi:hypothetical protein
MKRLGAVGLLTFSVPRIMCAEKKETPAGEGANVEAVNTDFKPFVEPEAERDARM